MLYNHWINYVINVPSPLLIQTFQRVSDWKPVASVLYVTLWDYLSYEELITAFEYNQGPESINALLHCHSPKAVLLLIVLLRGGGGKSARSVHACANSTVLSYAEGENFTRFPRFQ